MSLDAALATEAHTIETASRDTTGTEQPVTRFASQVSAEAADETGRWIGARLRSIREQKRLSLVDVERLSGGDLGTSTIGAYERGDRAISIRRLDRIADFYGVPIEQFLPRQAGESPITVRTSPISESLRIDGQRLAPLRGESFVALQRYIAIVRGQRGDHTSGAITLRGADAVVIAAMFAVATEAIVEHLRSLDLIASTSTAS